LAWIGDCFVRPLSEDLQDRIDGIMVPGQAIVLDLAQLTFLDTSAIHCFIRAEAESGHPVS